MTIGSVLGAILIGLVVGVLGRLVVPGKQPLPIWLTILVGIVAAFIGTALAKTMGIPINTPGIDWGELLVQVIVAALGVALVSAMVGGGYRRGTFGRGAFGRPRSRLSRRW
ncbi:MAG: hypothetical protein QOH60_2586 [Mycobacterium sp.]|jgi:uncharacterized membrane protein YeaQ/YmgE (transglycosylase-associated protein family)|nr:hypothetical protein [Mycobacterium sp.]